MNTKDLSINIYKNSEAFAEVLSACRTLLKYHPKAECARNYLNARISTHYQNVFKFGYFPNSEDLNILTDVVGEKILFDLELVYNRYVADTACMVPVKQGSLSNHNLIMPYKDVHGNIIAFVGRRLNENNSFSKYKNTIFYKSLHLFGLYHSKRSALKNKSILIVEGQFDCISCHEHGFHNVIALGGTSFSKYQFSLLTRYTNNLYLLLDNDTAGMNATNKIIKKYSKFANIQKIQLPPNYKDIDEYLRKSNNYNALDI